MEAPLRPQPDFIAMAQGHSVLADQFSRFVNVPAIDHGQQILDALAGINTRLDRIEVRLDRMDERFDRMDERFDRIEARLDRMEARIDRMEARITINETNSIARLQNTRVTRVDVHLVPLYAVSTMAAIENYPRTVADIDRLTTAEVTRILGLLEQPTNGPLAEKRMRLKTVTGILTLDVL